VNEKLVFEGSFELTPYFQRDIDSLRPISPRFLAMLLLGAALLTVEWLLARQSLPEMYAFLLGAMVLTQLTIHIRHLRNLVLFRSTANTNALRGRVEYSRLLLLRMSSAELLTFSGLFFLLFVFTQNWLMLGGMAGCFFTALKHQRLARKLPKIAANQELAQPVR
jgi:hypothetical protein